MKPLEERMSGNSKRMSEIHMEVERRAAWSEEGDGEEVKTMSRKLGEEFQNTLWLATSWGR